MMLWILHTPRPAPVVTPYAAKAPLSIGMIRCPASSVACYRPVDIDLELGATYDNPFDPDDVSVDATIQPPRGDAYTVPGYFDRPYTRRLVGGRETSEPAGPARWRLRLAALTPGEQHVVVRVRDRNGVVSKEFTFTATDPKSAGFVRVSPRDKRFFETSDGKSFYPIGEDLCWPGEKGMADYDRWIPALGNAKANFGRLWLSPGFVAFALEVPGRAQDGKGMGQFDLANAAKLDYVLDLAERNGVKLMLTIDSFNILRDRDGYPYWEQTPHNAANGGPLRRMKDFWTDAAMARLYRNKLRYLVARYSALESVFSWELWNEVDVIRDFEPGPVRAWHAEMISALKKMDPYRHLVTTSMGETDGRKDVELGVGLDYFQTHHYSSPDLAGVVAEEQARKGAWGRPHMIGEIGADVSGDPHAAQDRPGHQVHDPIWASVATGCAGTAQPWFWDSLVDPNNLYPLFTSAAKFVKGVDFPGEGFVPVRPTLEYAVAAPRTRQDLTIIGQAENWSANPLHQPQRREIKGAEMVGCPILEMQHGIANHLDWHNPIEFGLSLDKPGKFEVEISRVSGHGGAKLKVQIDGETILAKDFADLDAGKTDDLTTYNGDYTVSIPAGRHTLKVENVGTDWFVASYRFVGIAPPSSRPPIDVWAIAGKRTVLGWARVSGRTWPRVVVYKNAPATAPASTLRLTGIAPGAYRVTLWNTWTAAPIRVLKAVAKVSGAVSFPLPEIHQDLAFKLEKEGRG